MPINFRCCAFSISGNVYLGGLKGQGVTQRLGKGGETSRVRVHKRV